jgi:6-phosphogluconolactonase
VRVETVASELLAGRAAIWLADHIWSAVAERDVAHVAVSGGRTPGAMLRALDGLLLPWERVHIWQVDERVAPDGDPDRNATDLVAALPRRNLHLMPVTAHDLQGAAAEYAAALRAACDGVLDIVHLGMGDDGHTASWPPGDRVIEITDHDVAIAGPFHDHLRMTLTVPAVNRARRRMMLVSGADKAPALAKVMAGDRSMPASRVASDTVVLTDPPARTSGVA